MALGTDHDACHLSRVAPSAMISIPCRSGISHIIGHTDSTESKQYNLDLSLQRASNATAVGRQLNRRVEIILKPASKEQG